MANKTIKMNETQLRNMISESVKRVLKEYEGDINTPNMSEQLISQFANLILNATDENTANSLATEIYWSFGDTNKGMDAIEGLLMRFEPEPNKAAQINNTDFPQ